MNKLKIYSLILWTSRVLLLVTNLVLLLDFFDINRNKLNLVIIISQFVLLTIFLIVNYIDVKKLGLFLKTNYLLIISFVLQIGLFVFASQKINLMFLINLFTLLIIDRKIRDILPSPEPKKPLPYDKMY